MFTFHFVLVGFGRGLTWLGPLCFLAQVGVGLEGGIWQMSPGHSTHCLRQEKEADRIAE